MLTCLAIFALSVHHAAAKETIHGSVVVARTGERMPLLYSQQGVPVVLTSLGAQQSYAAGQAIRARYMDESLPTFLSELSIDLINPTQIYALTVDDQNYQFYPASAQAFMQGLYPPILFNGTDQLGNNQVLANGTIEDYPLNGYQFAWVHAPSEQDPTSVYIQGFSMCFNWINYFEGTRTSEVFNQTVDAQASFYQAVGEIMQDGEIGIDAYSYSNAYAIYDYLSFQAQHSTPYLDKLTEGTLEDDNALNRLHWLGNQHEWQLYGNTASISSDENNEISIIGARSMISQVYSLLQSNMNSLGQQNIVNLLTVEYPNFLSWFALADLPSQNANFEGIPDWASVMVFELFSFEGATLLPNSTYPEMQDLNVRFFFQNGTAGEDSEDADNALTAYSIFGNSEDYMSLADFTEAISAGLVATPLEWCEACSSWDYATFCAAASTASGSEPDAGSDSSDSDHGLSPKAAGVIGAVATLGAVGICLILLTLCAGLRFTTVGHRRSENAMGGFKGTQKLASDPDLTMYKSDVGASVEPITKERVSSWELRNNQPGARTNMPRPLSFGDDDRLDLFADPVRVNERV